ncbi:hypothetical protein NQ318_015148 [Aromia moschata]|uniref:RNA (guanine-9-)-methyltransferase domain-containing protein 1 n=1 Tax=Aromia moschata TaxID=1265417 RepID=A0AAV8X9J8_9CUCU|nr:hypothetical protein NQ318_015148 [Aromia moschata]
MKPKEIDYETITNGDKDLEHKLKVIMLEAEVMRQEGKLVPPISCLTQEHWKDLLNFPTRSARRKYFEFLFKIHKKKENRQNKKLERRQQWEEQREVADSEVEKQEETIEEFALEIRFTAQQHAMMFGQKLVVDCGYDADMTKRENTNCAKQLMLLFADNRLHSDPFDLHFCNVPCDSVLIKQLKKFIPTLYETSFPLNMHENSYLEVFPKDQLVYLTPHCREEMLEFDHNAVYIIGGIVDKVNNQPLSLAKAKKEGLKMQKLPLDKYLQWGSGSGKSLTLNQVICILNDIKVTGNWEYSLRHVPRRKIADFNISRNVDKATDSLRYDRPRREKTWTPAANVNFDNLSYKGNSKSKEKTDWYERKKSYERLKS